MSLHELRLRGITRAEARHELSDALLRIIDDMENAHQNPEYILRRVKELLMDTSKVEARWLGEQGD